MMQSNWEAVKALALDTSTELHQQPTSPLQDSQSAAQVSSFHDLFLAVMLSYWKACLVQNDLQLVSSHCLCLQEGLYPFLL